MVLPPFYRTWWFLMLAGLLTIGVAALAWKLRIRRWERAQVLQQAFSRQLIESQEGERKRMAAELHDSLGQQLLIIKNRADLGVRVADGQGRSREQFQEITTSASMAIDEVRRIAYDLRPPNLERLGLTAVIEELIEKVSAASGIQVSADIAPLDGVLSADQAINLYRILQESTNNVVRHAQAGKANVEIWHEGGGLHITVADNGRGFSLESQGARGLGLTSIAERVKMLGGRPHHSYGPRTRHHAHDSHSREMRKRSGPWRLKSKC